MNLFEIKNDTIEKIYSRSNHIVDVALEYAKELNCLALLPEFLRGYHGFHIETWDSVEISWVNNPHYDLDAPHTPENIALETGFSNVEVRNHIVQIKLEENGDPYEDFDTDTHYMEKLPLGLYLNGSDEELKEFFAKTFVNASERIKSIEDRDRFACLMNFTPDELKLFAETEARLVKEERAWDKFEEIVKEFKIANGEPL